MKPEHYGVRSLSPGTRSHLLRFEKAVRDLESAKREHGVLNIAIEKEIYLKAKRAVVRRLRRLEGTLPKDTRGRPRRREQ